MTSTNTENPQASPWKLILKTRHMAEENPQYLHLLIIIARTLITKVTGKYGEANIYPLALLMSANIEVLRRRSVFFMYAFLLALGYLMGLESLLTFNPHPQMPFHLIYTIILTAILAVAGHRFLSRENLPKFHKFERGAPDNVAAKVRMLADFAHAYEFIDIMGKHVGLGCLQETTSLEDLQYNTKQTFKALARSVTAKISHDEDETARKELRFMISTSITFGIFAYTGMTESEVSKELYTEAFRQDRMAQPA